MEETIECGICGNCIRWKGDADELGHCYYNPKRIPRKSTDPACINQCPKKPTVFRVPRPIGDKKEWLP